MRREEVWKDALVGGEEKEMDMKMKWQWTVLRRCWMLYLW